jgi:hypothetical protein
VDDFDVLQAAWNRQPAADLSRDQAGAVASRLAGRSRREVSIGGAKAGLAAAALLVAVLSLLRHGGLSTAATIGIWWCAAAVLGAIVVQWRERGMLARLDFAAPSAAFAEAALAALARHDRVVVTVARALTVALVLGLNLIVSGVAIADPSSRVAGRVACTAIPVAAYAAGAALRRRRARGSGGSPASSLRTFRDVD